MQNSKIRQMSLTGILTALVVVLGRFVMLPTPTGFLTLLDAGIYAVSFSFDQLKELLWEGYQVF